MQSKAKKARRAFLFKTRICSSFHRFFTYKVILLSEDVRGKHYFPLAMKSTCALVALHDTKKGYGLSPYPF
ncbi:MAG: hypothetical protein CVU64_07170 [Deltaproteobacteria bacterium HGW-Deltaproteobacteria-21]|nr:MAG: hypothetical protein CVU64_07170 [Deltaproteobacteria bacterium HGW-Deltaproteobacteria-21]